MHWSEVRCYETWEADGQAEKSAAFSRSFSRHDGSVAGTGRSFSAPSTSKYIAYMESDEVKVIKRMSYVYAAKYVLRL